MIYGIMSITCECVLCHQPAISLNLAGLVWSFLKQSSLKQLLTEGRYHPQISSIKGPFKCYVTLFFWKFNTHPPPRNANNVEPYIFVMLFSGKSDTLPPHLCYITLEWLLPYSKQSNIGLTQECCWVCACVGCAHALGVRMRWVCACVGCAHALGVAKETVDLSG